MRLVPADAFTGLLQELRRREPDAEITALAASDHIDGASEVIDWRRTGGRQLATELRRRCFDVVVLAHGQDHYATRAYWRAVLLVSLTGAREVVLCEEGQLGRRHSVFAGAGRAVLQAVQETCGAAFALLVLLPVVLMAVVTDLAEGTSLAIGRRRG
jgi:hypothetical protein